MRRVLLPTAMLMLLVVISLILASALARPLTPPLAGGVTRVEQVDASAYPKLSLYVSVADAGGKPRLGLDSGAVAVTEDGAPVAITAFGGAGAGAVTSVLVLDHSGSMAENHKIDGAREAATAFVKLLRPGDRAAVVAFNEDIQVAQPFSGDVTALNDAISKLQPENGTALYDAVVAGVELLRNEPGRRLLLVLSDGQDCRVPLPLDTCPDESGSKHTLAEAIAYAETAGQPVAVVGLGNRASSATDEIDETVLRQIADSTGGRYFYAPQSDALAELYTGLAGDVQREYRLTYVSPRPFYDGTRRNIQVRVGASTATGSYTELHLINVAANPLVGVALLVPLAVLLVLPGRLRRRRNVGAAPTGEVNATPAHAIAPPEPRLGTEPTLTLPVGTAEPALLPVSATAAVAEERRCMNCAAPLRATARFCSTCGTTQTIAPAPTSERRTFCDMCGRPVEAGTPFCMHCGEPVVERRQQR